MSQPRVGIFGATGYSGAELAALLESHPGVQIGFATSRSEHGTSLARVVPGAPDIPLVAPDAAPLDEVELAFLCLPHGAAAATAVRALESGARVIDLSADFRLRRADVYEQWYATEHPARELLQEAVYGLTELATGRLPEARLVANPGCYPTSVLLGLAPLLSPGPPERPAGTSPSARTRRDPIHGVGVIVADSKSGVSGAGRGAKLHTSFVEVSGNLSAYAVGRSHRHLPEMEQCLDAWSRGERLPGDPGSTADHGSSASSGSVAPPDEPAEGPVDVGGAPGLIFTPYLLPVPRGILTTMYVPLAPSAPDGPALRDRYERFYADAAFVEVLAADELPTLAHVIHTNRCAIGLRDVETRAGRTLIVFAAIDNLVKGAAGQAVQNMNLMMGFDEAAGLR